MTGHASTSRTASPFRGPFRRYRLCILLGHRWTPRYSAVTRDQLWWTCPRCWNGTITEYKDTIGRRPKLSDWNRR